MPRPRCFYCERKFLVHYDEGILIKTTDHVHPKSKGGNKQIHNIVSCCDQCNQLKKNYLPEVFLAMLNGLIDHNTPIEPFTIDRLKIVRKNLMRLQSNGWSTYKIKSVT